LICLANETRSERNMKARHQNGNSWKRLKERTQNKKEHLVKHRRHEANPLVQITKKLEVQHQHSRPLLKTFLSQCNPAISHLKTVATYG
jgi:hypothetical protein